ncbi:LacI family DNA-binding transcriptional regulator [Coraliomargarita sp. SDUM461003]|uniref:LacI family DNA-binding transcriptional regulator n=1 Tax=Thalassobacterium maritimum TaxID=3041265 RepID=A0ABU1B0R7_9BACT|nr:LacI family DNA-binding transcriptional regulator [Coraliomargarita sp. SDUM461003]MDQ8208882.1 LacI family DNA-binding transcriptional regulator [Coraliomargarita sp. SDUM461003]
MAEPKRVRLKDIAAEVGVSTMLVSIALRGMPGVSEATRKKIQACADKMGYHPDPALSALADYRRRTRPAHSYAQIAYVTNYATPNPPLWNFANEFLLGAQKRGLEYGYEVIPYWLKEHGCTLRKASSILFNRGIKGLLIAPLPEENSQLDLSWKYFSAVAIGTSLASPKLDYVAFDHHEAMQMTLEKLRNKGYQRIGLLLRNPSNRLRHTSLDAYLGDQYRIHKDRMIPPLLQSDFSSSEFWSWYDTHKPDAIITDSDLTIIDLLNERGLKAPQDVGVVCYSKHSTENIHISAVNQNLQNIGATAVDRLHTNLLRSAYGVPEHSYATLVHGNWSEGTTLKK